MKPFNYLYLSVLILIMTFLPACRQITPTPEVNAPIQITASTTPTTTLAPFATSPTFPTVTPYSRIPQQVEDGWETSSLQDAGIDPVTINRMLDAIFHGPGRGSPVFDDGSPKIENIHSILIVRNGKLVLEEYFYHYGRTNSHDTFSATKSITSLLVGLAIDGGFLTGVDEKVLPWFPDHASDELDPRWSDLTVEDLLTMRTGLDCDDWSPDSPTYYLKNFEWRHSDSVTATFSLPMKTDPGTEFSYCSSGVDLLGALLTRLTGMPLSTYANQVLFNRLDMPDQGFLELPGGWPDAAGNLPMTPRNMARIGQLVLQEGRWGDQQVIPRAWITLSTSRQEPLPFNSGWGNGYGYLWWLSRISVRGQVVRSVSASGFGGQVISIFPELDMVVVMTGGNFEHDDGQPFQIMERYILPAVLP